MSLVCKKNKARGLIRVMILQWEDWERSRLGGISLINAVPTSGFQGGYLIPGGPYVYELMAMLQTYLYEIIILQQIGFC